MKTLVFDEVGPLSVLRWEEKKVPLLQPQHVLLKMTSVGLNRADSVFREGRYFIKPRFPSQIGFEGAGIVEAVGENSSYRKGNRVALLPCSLHPSIYGCCAEYGIFPEQYLIQTPDTICDSMAGGIWMQYLTVWGALLQELRILPGQVVVLPAASSSVGIAAIQLVNQIGAISIATTTHFSKKEALLRLGAQYVLDVNDPDYVVQVKAISQGRGADIVFDPVAGPSLQKHLAAMAPYGKICVYGLLDRRPMEVHAGVLMKKQITLSGYTLDRFYSNQPVLQSMIQGIRRGLEQKWIVPVVAKQFPLDDAIEAFSYLESNEQIGKIILTSL